MSALAKLAGVPLDDPQGACHMGVDQSPSNLAPAVPHAAGDLYDELQDKLRALYERRARIDEAWVSGMQRRWALQDIDWEIDAVEEELDALAQEQEEQ